MYFPGFDPKTLSNEELFERQMTLSEKKIMAARFGKMDAVNQISAMIQAIELERRERMFTDKIGNHILASPPVVIESDPAMQEQNENPQEQKPKQEPTPRHIQRRMRTAQPVAPTTQRGD